MAKQSDNKIKGNPAHKRMSNTRLKARRAESWGRGEARKAERRAAEQARHRANVEAGTSAWEIAQAKRAANRA